MRALMLFAVAVCIAFTVSTRPVAACDGVQVVQQVIAAPTFAYAAPVAYVQPLAFAYAQPLVQFQSAYAVQSFVAAPIVHRVVQRQVVQRVKVRPIVQRVRTVQRLRVH